MHELLRPYQPRLPLERLVEEINALYHAFESCDYDRRHPELFEQIPRFWQGMLTLAQSIVPGGNWTVLDFGCGTGFEALQILRWLRPGSLLQLTCYDPAAEMLARCQERVQPRFANARFCSTLEEVRSVAPVEGYAMLATNSLLHHLPVPAQTIAMLGELLSSEAVWLAGHEPSRRFYQNPVCRQVYAAFLRERRWRRVFQLRTYLRRMDHLLRMVLGRASDPARQTARLAYQRNMFAVQPPAELVHALVDFHVARPGRLAVLERGFDVMQLQNDLRPEWHLLWSKSYSFMGYYYEADVSPRWRRQARRLTADFPDDGANFCALWQRRALAGRSDEAL
jgi:SAM-dependent methyltransferase